VPVVLTKNQRRQQLLEEQAKICEDIKKTQEKIQEKIFKPAESRVKEASLMDGD